MTEKKHNNQFLLLRAIAITLIVFGHKGNGGVNILNDWFFSYTLPLFIFISGYFFKESYIHDMTNFVFRKIKTLIIPYFGWNLVYGVLMFFLTKHNFFVSNGASLTLKSFFVDSWIHGHQYLFNLATWFVLILFLVQILYLGIHWLRVKLKFKNDFILLIILVFLSVLSVVLSSGKYGYNGLSPVYKLFFFMPFFHFGYYYQKKMQYWDKLGSFWYFGILFLIQYFITSKYENADYIISWLNFHDHTFLPIVVSFTGILFWLRVSRILTNTVGQNKIVQYMGKNTWDIMVHHLFVFFLINCFFYLIGVPNFDNTAFRKDIWYSYQPFGNYRILLFYSALGIGVPLLYRYYETKIAYSIHQNKIYRNCKSKFLRKNNILCRFYNFYSEI
jgi:fucose 4-O-acetylase-like acetyltransferase